MGCGTSSQQSEIKHLIIEQSKILNSIKSHVTQQSKDIRQLDQEILFNRQLIANANANVNNKSEQPQIQIQAPLQRPNVSDTEIQSYLQQIQQTLTAISSDLLLSKSESSNHKPKQQSETDTTYIIPHQLKFKSDNDHNHKDNGNGDGNSIKKMKTQMAENNSQQVKVKRLIRPMTIDINQTDQNTCQNGHTDQMNSIQMKMNFMRSIIRQQMNQN